MGVMYVNENNVARGNLKIATQKGLGGNHLAGIRGSQTYLRGVLTTHAQGFIGAYAFTGESLRIETWLIEEINLLKPSTCADTKHHMHLGCWDLGNVLLLMNIPKITKQCSRIRISKI